MVTKLADNVNVDVGDVILSFSYAKVNRVIDSGSTVSPEGTLIYENPDSLDVTDLDTGLNYQILGKALVDACLSADTFETEEKVSKTELAQTLVSSYNVPLTVAFTKLDGSERILRGRLIKPEPLFGKSLMEDLDIDGDTKKRMRYVIHEHLNWIIVEGVKYIRKGK
jgi:hypothetical protein